MIKRDVAIGITNALRSGTVPAQGLEFLAVGVEPLRTALTEQRDYVGRGHSGYKFLRGDYGAGKTFLASLAAAEAHTAGYATSRVVISVADTPLHRLATVYRRICAGLSTRERAGGGAAPGIIDRWLYNIEQTVMEVQKISEDDPKYLQLVAERVDTTLKSVGDVAGRLASALKAYHRAQHRGDFTERQGVLDWLCGDDRISAAVKKSMGLTGKVENEDAKIFLRGWLELLRSLQYKGLVLILDEVETVLRLRKPDRQKSFEILRELIDACDKNELPGLQLIITGTPEVFESTNGVPSLAPLHQRIGVKFKENEPDNYKQAQIRLRTFDLQRLKTVALRVKDIYPAKDPGKLSDSISSEFIDQMIGTVSRHFGGKVELTPRQFLRQFVNVLDLCDQEATYNPKEDWRFDPQDLGALTVEEEEAISAPVEASKRRITAHPPAMAATETNALTKDMDGRAVPSSKKMIPPAEQSADVSLLSSVQGPSEQQNSASSMVVAQGNAKFHRIDCPWLKPDIELRKYSGRNEAIAEDLKPCGTCKP